MNSKNKVFKKGVSVALAIATSLSLSAGALVMPLAASADATSDLIASLQAQIAALSSQLTALSGSSMSSGSSAKCVFTKSLTMGMRGDDVTCLQNYLKGTGHFTYSGGATGFFGGVTKAAVAAWQSANGVSPAVGYFGPLSQAKYSSMVVVVPVVPVVPGVTPGVVSLGSGLTVSAGMQPSEALAPNSAARIPFTKVVLTASSDGDVMVKSLTVERQGVGVDAALSEVVLLDEDGIQIGLGKTLNSNHQVMLNEVFTVKAGTSRTMTLGASRPSSDSSSVAGQIIRLALVGVDAGSVMVYGSLPIVGNGMTMNASLTLGSVTVQTGSFKTVATTTEDIGKTAFKFTSVRVTAGSQEKVRITSIRWNQVGSAGVGDVANVKTVFDGTEYDAVASADGKYYTSKFGSGMVLDKGMSAEIYIKGDIMGGANRTVKFDLYRTTDLAVSGETYGYGITPPTSGTGFTSTNPWYFASQVTVGKGSLNVENATAIQAQNIAVNLSNQVLGGFSVEVRGEPVSVAKMIFNIATTSTGIGQLTSVAIYNSSGAIVAGPVDDNNGDDATLTFTDTVTFPIGKGTYTVKGKTPSGWSNNGTIQVSSTPSTQWTTVRGQITNETIAPTPSSAVSLSTMTAKSASLALSVSTDPVAQTVVAGGNQFTFANYQLDASASGEDVRLPSLPIEYNAASGATNLTSCQLYDGATSVTSGSNIVNPSAAASSTIFTLDGSGMTVTKGTIKTLTLKCNIASGASGTYAWGYDSASSPTATGLTSGQSVTVAESDSAGQLMTLTSGGTFTVALDSSSPAFAVATAGSTGNTVATLRFTTVNEAMDLKSVGLQLSNTASNSPSDLVKLTVWDGAIKVGEAIFTPSGVNPDFATSTFTSAVRIDKDTSKVLTVKADFSAQGTSQIGTPGSRVHVDWDGEANLATEAAGVSSGTTIRTTGTDTASAGVVIYKSYPTVSSVALSDTKLTAGRRDLFRFNVSANSAGDVGIYHVTFRIATSSATQQVDMIDGLNVYAFTDSTYATPVSGIQTDGAMQQGNLDISASWASASTNLTIGAADASNASTTVVVPAGQTRYFVIRGDATTAGTQFSVATQVQGDSKTVSSLTSGTSQGTYMATTTYILSSGDKDFVWRPFSTTTTQGVTANDYTTGYGLPGLPTTNMNQSILTQ